MMHIKTPAEIEEFKVAGSLSKAVLRRAGRMVRPGVTTREIDQVVESFIRLHGAVPGFKGLYGFPASICSSVNEEIVHGIPSERVLVDGDIGFAVQSLAESHGYGVVREYVGHGVGHVMHEDPNVPNFGKRGRGVRLQAGMVIAIEPMITLGTHKNHTLANGWTVVTNDGSPAAHYENTVAITKDGPVILTQDAEGPWCPFQGGV